MKSEASQMSGGARLKGLPLATLNVSDSFEIRLHKRPVLRVHLNSGVTEGLQVELQVHEIQT
jgi:hypothetical protein